jgi:RNA polymerase sigma-70 factor (ECF subfamily)
LEDQSSWQDFFDTYSKLIYNVASESGLSKPEAEDVVQETIISVAKHMPTFKYDRSIGSFKAWLFNLTRWRIADQMRKRKGLPSSDDPSADLRMYAKMVDPISEHLEALWNAEWEKTLYDAAVEKVKRQLDPQNYQIFDFLVNKEWPPAKVADVFGISISKVYMAKHRVTEMITEEVKKLEKKTS